MTISQTAEKSCYPMAVTMKTAIFWVCDTTDWQMFQTILSPPPWR